MDDNITVLFFRDKLTLISQVERITPPVIGDPDVRLIEPFVLELISETTLVEVVNNSSRYRFTPWLMEYTDDNDFFIHSDKILTSVNPTNLLKHLYKAELNKSALSVN